MGDPTGTWGPIFSDLKNVYTIYRVMVLAHCTVNLFALRVLFILNVFFLTVLSLKKLNDFLCKDFVRLNALKRQCHEIFYAFFT